MGWYWDILHVVFRMFTEEIGWFVQNVELKSCIHLYWNCRLFSGQFCGNAICSWKDYIYIEIYDLFFVVHESFPIFTTYSTTLAIFKACVFQDGQPGPWHSPWWPGRLWVSTSSLQRWKDQHPNGLGHCNSWDPCDSAERWWNDGPVFCWWWFFCLEIWGDKVDPCQISWHQKRKVLFFRVMLQLQGTKDKFRMLRGHLAGRLFLKHALSSDVGPWSPAWKITVSCPLVSPRSSAELRKDVVTFSSAGKAERQRRHGEVVHGEGWTDFPVRGLWEFVSCEARKTHPENLKVNQNTKTLGGNSWQVSMPLVSHNLL